MYSRAQCNGALYAKTITIEPDALILSSMTNPEADNDGDRIANILEIFLGTDPEDSSSFIPIAIPSRAYVNNTDSATTGTYDFTLFPDYPSADSVPYSYPRGSLENPLIPLLITVVNKQSEGSGFDDTDDERVGRYVEILPENGIDSGFTGEVGLPVMKTLPAEEATWFVQNPDSMYAWKEVEEISEVLPDSQIKAPSVDWVMVPIEGRSGLGKIAFTQTTKKASGETGRTTLYFDNDVIITKNARPTLQYNVRLQTRDADDYIVTMNIEYKELTSGVVKYAPPETLDYVTSQTDGTPNCYAKTGKVVFDDSVQIIKCRMLMQYQDGAPFYNDYECGTGYTIAFGQTMQMVCTGITAEFITLWPPPAIAFFYSRSFTFESAGFGDGRIITLEAGGDPEQSYTYDYFLTDHLGSTRMVINDQKSITEAVMYQPYGTMVPVRNISSPEATVRNKFTTKEFDEEGPDMGLLELDFTFNFPLSDISPIEKNRMAVYYEDAPSDPAKADIISAAFDPESGKWKINGTVKYTAERKVQWLDFALNGSLMRFAVIGINELMTPGKKVTISHVFTSEPALNQMFARSEMDMVDVGSVKMAGIGRYYFGARYYDPEVGVWGSVDRAGQFWSGYGYGTNPVIMVDEDGNFITWSIGRNGISIGLNFSPVVIGYGFGLNVGWGNGFSLGRYVEVGYRLGGTGFGLNGGTISNSLDYNFRNGDLSTTTTESIGASFLVFNTGASMSQRYSFTNDSWDYSWGVSAGIGVGDGNGNTFGFNFGYGGDFKGNNQISYGLSGTSSRAGHFKRNEINGDLTLADAIDGQGKLKDGWIEMNDRDMKKYHTQGLDPESVYKYVNVKTGKELIVLLTNDGKPIVLNQYNSPKNMGTLNYYTPTNPLTYLAHFGVDMLPYYFYGNASNDGTNFGKRVWRSFE